MSGRKDAKVSEEERKEEEEEERKKKKKKENLKEPFFALTLLNALAPLHDDASLPSPASLRTRPFTGSFMKEREWRKLVSLLLLLLLLSSFFFLPSPPTSSHHSSSSSFFLFSSSLLPLCLSIQGVE